MAIRLRVVDGVPIAVCAARSMPQEADIYLDDGWHHALAVKFDLDYQQVPIHEDSDEARLMAQEESNNPNRTWWDKTYGTHGPRA